jgi:PAS domain S-box-containing protein
LMDSFCQSVGIASAIIDLEGKVFVSSNWQKLCTDFHRKNPVTFKRCVESDTFLANKLQSGEKYAFYTCRNGLTDAASPIVVQGNHIANLFVGQFLLTTPEINEFRKQAKLCGFNETHYLETLSLVPVVPEDKAQWILKYLVGFAELLGDMGLTAIVQKETNIKLRASEEHYRVLIDNINLGITLLNPKHQIVMINKMQADMFNKPADYFINKYCFREFEKKEHVCTHCPGTIAMKTGKPAETVTKGVRDNGSSFDARVMAFPLFENGVPSGFIEVVEDITERLEAENKLKCFRDALENSTDAIGFSTPQGHHYYQNRAFDRLFGDVGVNPPDTLYVDKMVGEKVFKTIMSGGQWNGEVKMNGKNGQILDIDLRAYANKDKDGNIISLVGVHSDITARKQMEENAKQTQKMEAIGTLAGGIAHDFNNILGGIIGYTELAIDNLAQGNRTQNYLEEILKSAIRAKDLVKQILTFSRKSEEERKPIPLAMIVKEATMLLRSTIPTTIEIRQNIVDTTAMVHADPTQMHQIVMNLCTNAANAMQEGGGLLEISLSSVELTHESVRKYHNVSPGSFLMMKVSDTGTGIDSRIIHRVFEPFFTTKEKGKGTGMGLAVVHGIVKDHGGDIIVESQPGKGTTFTIILPQVLTETSKKEEIPFDVPTGSEHILFVDDEEMLTDVGKPILESLGYTVTAVNSSVEALEIFNQSPDVFDMVITDQTMPHLTGYDLAKRILENNPSIPIIIITGYSDTVTAEKVEAAGISALIHKPIRKKEIARTIHEILIKHNRKKP